jgi:hypothetical protein
MEYRFHALVIAGIYIILTLSLKLILGYICIVTIKKFGPGDQFGLMSGEFSLRIGCQIGQDLVGGFAIDAFSQDF